MAKVTTISAAIALLENKLALLKQYQAVSEELGLEPASRPRRKAKATAKKVPAKRKISRAGREAIAKAQRVRWAKVRAAAKAKAARKSAKKAAPAKKAAK